MSQRGMSSINGTALRSARRAACAIAHQEEKAAHNAQKSYELPMRKNTGRTRTCGFDMLQYDGLGVPVRPLLPLTRHCSVGAALSGTVLSPAIEATVIIDD